MKRNIIIDTGPLVATINRKAQFHPWAVEELKTISQPLHTCEAVLSEASFLLQFVYGGRQALLEWLTQGLIVIDFQLSVEIQAVKTLMAQYESVPMALADACLVRMAEIKSNSTVFTIDNDFRIYRLHKNQSIPVIIPN